jgi:hypothetical protein
MHCRLLASLSDRRCRISPTQPAFGAVSAPLPVIRIDWVRCLSKEVFSELDYVLTDSWTVRDANGKRIKAFSREYDPGKDSEAFMKWYVEWIIEILESAPLDIWSSHVGDAEVQPTTRTDVDRGAHAPRSSTGARCHSRSATIGSTRAA